MTGGVPVVANDQDGFLVLVTRCRPDQHADAIPCLAALAAYLIHSEAL